MGVKPYICDVVVNLSQIKYLQSFEMTRAIHLLQHVNYTSHSCSIHGLIIKPSKIISPLGCFYCEGGARTRG